MDYKKEYEKLNKEYKKLLLENEKLSILIDKCEEEIDNLITNIKVLDHTISDISVSSKKSIESIKKLKKDL